MKIGAYLMRLNWATEVLLDGHRIICIDHVRYLINFCFWTLVLFVKKFPPSYKIRFICRQLIENRRLRAIRHSLREAKYTEMEWMQDCIIRQNRWPFPIFSPPQSFLKARGSSHSERNGGGQNPPTPTQADILRRNGPHRGFPAMYFLL